MLCPACKEEMLVIEFEKVELDFCSSCKGVWLDSGELALIGKRAGVLQKDLFEALESGAPDKKSGAGRRRCPVCRRRLEEVSTTGSAAITLDRCPARHGIWFDRGELEAVVVAGGADSDNVLTRFFGKLAE
jgi:Zn-finger nucleic acid-binding protein